jgi:hypothetical protein
MTGRSGFDPRQGQRIFPLASVSRPALGPTQPPVQWVPGVLSPGVKRGWCVMLTTHPHLVPRSWMSRSYISSPPQAPPWCVTGLLYFFTFTSNILLEMVGKISTNKGFAVIETVVKSYFWIQFPHFRFKTFHISRHGGRPMSEHTQSCQCRPFSRRYSSVTLNVSSPVVGSGSPLQKKLFVMASTAMRWSWPVLAVDSSIWR